MSESAPATSQVELTLPIEFAWLVDAPLFIDADQVSRFYDAVGRPEYRTGAVTVVQAREIEGKAEAKVQLDAGLKLGGLLSRLGLLPVEPELKGSASGSGSIGRSDTASTTWELIPICTPQRDLVSLTLHYHLYYGEQCSLKRLFFVNDTRLADWRDPSTISQVPRELAFLDLPGQMEARQSGRPETMLIPTAAEFENGKVVLLYNKLKGRDRHGSPPPYPEREADTSTDAARRDYWKWFAENFSSRQAIETVEKAASSNGRIRWINYRMPITTNGDTLHLRMCPSGKFDTGVLAYDLIRRGHAHGLRLVGTLRSAPSMNVLAVYER